MSRQHSASQGVVRLLQEQPAPALPLRLALTDLSHALEQHDYTVVTGEAAGVTAATVAQFTLGLAGASVNVDRLLRGARLNVPAAPESLLIHRLPGAGPVHVVLAGRDERGLTYAVLEAAEALRLAPRGADPFAALLTGAESPAVRWRALSIHLMNADLEREWYFSEDFWQSYFARLARNRYNSFRLTFADQTNYLAPPYPWLFAIPEYPDVQVAGLGQEEQARNLTMLRRISELATAHGLDFGVAIWQQRPLAEPGQPQGPYARNYGPTALRHLPVGPELADYNCRGLARLLQECPALRHLQLRVQLRERHPGGGRAVQLPAASLCRSCRAPAAGAAGTAAQGRDRRNGARRAGGRAGGDRVCQVLV